MCHTPKEKIAFYREKCISKLCARQEKKRKISFLSCALSSCSLLKAFGENLENWKNENYVNIFFYSGSSGKLRLECDCALWMSKKKVAGEIE